MTALSDDELELIQSTALFGGLDNELMSTLLKAVNVQEVEPGDILFMQGDSVDACFIVLDGWVKIYRLTQHGDEAVVSVFSRGQSFAEAAVFSMGVYPVAAEAVSETRLLRIPSQTLLDNVCQNPKFALSMLASTSSHLQQLVRQIEQLKTHTGAQRVARFLATLSPVMEGACTIGLPYDKALIASRLGMKPESLSRVFARLRQVGVRVERNAAAISNVELLRNFADEDRSETKMSKS